MTEMDSILRSRWSPRAFAERPIAPATLEQLFEAARWAPSCYNDQPWFFVFAQAGTSAAYDRFLATLVPFNQQWAQTAPLLLFGVAREVFERNGKPNRHAWYDLGQAMGILLAQATALGVHAHQMAGFDPAAAALACGLPADHSVVVAAALGYPGAPERLPDDLTENDPAARERKPLSDFVFKNEWAQSPF